MKRLKKEMSEYYSAIERATIDGNQHYQAVRQAIIDELEKFSSEHPDADAYTLKARQYEVIAEQFIPVIFPNSPFFFEMGIRFAENWGNPSPLNAGAWVYCKKENARLQCSQWRNIREFCVFQESPVKLWSIHHGFDFDHHCIGYEKILKLGVNGVLEIVAERLRDKTLGKQELSFLHAAQTGCRCLLQIAGKFKAKAEELRSGEVDPQARRFLTMIAEAATKVPANPPETFYEGLAMLWFLREVYSSLEGIGISVIGRLDKYLIDLYRADLAANRLTQDEAGDLLARWMLPTDIKFHVERNAWPETSTCLMLGGCDREGNPVYNELTELIITTHAKHGLLNPKLNCRVSKNSPKGYLDLLSDKTLAGHNNFSFMNDDVLIPALVRNGKTIEDARRYVNGGCQETMVEGVEHSAGAYYYFSMPCLLNTSLQGVETSASPDSEIYPYLPQKIAPCPTFGEFYSKFVAVLKKYLSLGAQWSREIGYNWQEVNPCPIFSTSIEGCLEKAADYSAGAAKYNPSGLALVGLATIADSLLAIKYAVYDNEICSYAELVGALEKNWEGCESLRRQLIAAPKFGHNDPQADQFTADLAKELGAFVKTLCNERGDHFQPSMFVYYSFSTFGRQIKATPDGRADGELLSQGTAPGRQKYPDSLTQIINSMKEIDYTEFPGNAVLDLQLPSGNTLSANNLTSIIRTFTQMDLPTLQPNCVSPDVLRDAVKHPEKHGDLTVRISGLSAKFVCLAEDVQQEIIDRVALA